MGRYPDDWDTRRKRVYRRDEYSCNNCAREGGPHGDHELHAHHIVPIASGGTHNETNLVTLCKACHRSIHNKNYKAPTHAGLPEQTGYNVEYEPMDPDTVFQIYVTLFVAAIFGFILLAAFW